MNYHSDVYVSLWCIVQYLESPIPSLEMVLPLHPVIKRTLPLGQGWEGTVGTRPDLQGGKVGKGRSPMLVVCLDDACGTDDDELRGLTHNNDAPGGEPKLQVCPRSPQRGPRPSKRNTLNQNTRAPQRERVVVRVQGGCRDLAFFLFLCNRAMVITSCFLLVTTLCAAFTSQVCDSYNVADPYMMCNDENRQVRWNCANNGTNSRSESVVSKECKKWHLKNHIM